jgi:hypothetical protein
MSNILKNDRTLNNFYTKELKPILEID